MLKNINQPNVGLAQKPEDALPITVIPGVVYGLNDFNFALDMAFQKDDIKLISGAEKWFLENTFAVRGGLGLGARNQNSISLGLGYHHNEMLALDYGFVWYLSGIKDIYGTHRLSLTFKFQR